MSLSLKNIFLEELLLSIPFSLRKDVLNISTSIPSGTKISLKNYVLALIEKLPFEGDYEPGEILVKKAKNDRPHTWTIEDDGREGLDFDAYDTSIRSPYIQNITQNSATVLWRVGIAKGCNPKEWVSQRKLEAKAWIAPLSIKVIDGELYTFKKVPSSNNKRIEINDITNTYRYEDGVVYNKDFPYDEYHQANQHYWLDSMFDRPVIQFKVTFKGLHAGTVYHYRIECDSTIDPDNGFITKSIVLADDVYFKTAPDPSQNQRISFLAMGDLGPGNDQPSYFYDVFDLFHKSARTHGANLWLVLGDIDNDTDGHPNAMDPFFFNIYNAYHDQNDPRLTSSNKKAAKTNVKAFRNPKYHGLLGGLPVYPTFGNHDICSDNDCSLNYWKKAYKGSFVLPPDVLFDISDEWSVNAQIFNAAGNAFFYTFRYGNVIFISLGIPASDCALNGGDWKEKWGEIQKKALTTYLKSIQTEVKKSSNWIIAYFHDNNYGLSRKKGETYPTNEEYAEIFLNWGVDLVLMGHQHFFKQGTVKDQTSGKDYHAVIVGTGGFGDHSDRCYRPGFILVDITWNVLRYWKYDTHECDSEGLPKGRDALNPVIKEYCRVIKKGHGKHDVKLALVNAPV